MSPAERRAQFAAATEREAERGYQLHKLLEGSDAALAFRALVGDGLIAIVRDRTASEQPDQPSKAA